ncbi:MAG: SRPBCC family protein [Lysobacterales bacterium]
MITQQQRRELELTQTSFSKARTLPCWVYTCPQVFEAEMQALFGQQWVCVGHQSQFENDSVVQLTVGQHALLISRNSSGLLQCFHNVCRHRGTRLVRQSQQRSALLVCPYHGWSYTLDGKLKAAPGMQDVKGFCAADQGLLKVNSQLWQGFLFICLGSLLSGTLLTDFPLPISDLSNLQVVASHHYEVAANWKLLGDNYNECYHCPAGHPQLHQITRPASDIEGQHRTDQYTGGPMTLREGYNTMSATGVTQRQKLPGWASSDEHLVHYFHVFPNLFLSFVPDYLMIHLLLPVSPARTAVQTHWLFAPQQIAAEGFKYDDAVDFWHVTNQQDWRLCEEAQVGQGTGVHRGGFYHPSERCVHDFDRWYAQWLSPLIDGFSDQLT